MWTKDEILAEIRHYGELHGGKIPGRDKFAELSGLGKAEYARYWARWGDAVREAGYEPNKLYVRKFTDEEMLERVALFVRELGYYPVRNEFGLKRRADREFPNYSSIERQLGNRPQLLKSLVELGERRNEFSDVSEICRPLISRTKEGPSGEPVTTGWVYLIRSGKFHKIGKANHVGRRSYEIGLQLPAKHELIHQIETDDPYGIESYWHNRFASKRQNGEWFLLSKEDVAAFKLRKKFM